MIDILVRLKDYVPLFQTLVWLLFILLLLFTYYNQVCNIISALVERIKNGSSFKAGPFEIGQDLEKLKYAEPIDLQNDSITIGAIGSDREKHRTLIYEKNRGVFLAHIITPSKKPDQKFDIYMYLVGHKRSNFNDVVKAEFFFGHMWGNQVYDGINNNGIIGISTSAYAPFLCTCCIKFNDGYEISLDRYIDFEMTRVYKK